MGRKRKEGALTHQQRCANYNAKKRQTRIDQIVICDFETDPFNNQSNDLIVPFLFVIYSPQIETQILIRDPILEPIPKIHTDIDQFILRCIGNIIAIPGKRVIFAHNGGKFDFKYMVRHLRGRFIAKGSSLMKINCGNHELRDSRHFYPMALSSHWKTDISYEKMSRSQRDQHMQEITDYCIADCKSLYEIVHTFVSKNGFRLSIGQAALAQVSKCVTVKRITEHQDGKIRGIDTKYANKETYGKPNLKGWYMGGLVSCLGGRGIRHGSYNLYDVNSMYPYVMASCLHPIGNDFAYRKSDSINDNTCFLHIRCHNHGALMKHVITPGNILASSLDVEYGEFRTTSHEFNVALELGLIEDVKILECIDCDELADFSSFVLPLYSERQQIKEQLYFLEQSGMRNSREYTDLKMTDTFVKLLLNNAYGKFGQNPRRFSQEYIVGWGEQCEDPEAKFYAGYPEVGFAIFRREKDVWNEQERSFNSRGPKDRLRFYNVATAASITGAARSKLLYAICNSVDPLYCDTDSLICRSLGPDQPLSQSELGGWKLESSFPAVQVAAKKVYCYTTNEGQFVSKTKGSAPLTQAQFNALDAGKSVVTLHKGINISWSGQQVYEERTITANAPNKPSLLRQFLDQRGGTIVRKVK